MTYYLSSQRPENNYVCVIIDGGTYDAMTEKMNRLASDNPANLYVLGTLRQYETFGYRYRFADHMGQST